jgi:hypothetical protein
MSNCDFVAGRSLINLVAAMLTLRPRAMRGFGLDPTKSISAVATSAADREGGGGPKRRRHEPWH